MPIHNINNKKGGITEVIGEIKTTVRKMILNSKLKNLKIQMGLFF